ncbi:MAG: hypothetical protein KUG82_21195 [Pseudomonadales bacterium]|nr:hypothetical protein [Pseudomonadales bacterium]
MREDINERARGNTKASVFLEGVEIDDGLVDNDLVDDESNHRLRNKLLEPNLLVQLEAVVTLLGNDL